MSRIVFCRKYQQEMPGLATAPFPGPKGLLIFNEISAQAWEDWQKQQVMLINEKHLSMASVDDRKYLQEQMELFLSNQNHDTASGYVAPDVES
jgi:Fe-S cluster biosynthesis and repair protein YggX